jgi:ABC-type multidrug transport system ATPase subunit/uncharacterized tellurite resistance protein B-like protein
MTITVFESIVKIFAIIAKSDGVVVQELSGFEKFLESQFDKSKSESYKKLFFDFSKNIEGTTEEMTKYAGEVCTELDIDQRLLIYVRICEIVKSDGRKTENETKLLKTLSNVFHLDESFIELIESFVFSSDEELLRLRDVGYIQNGYLKYLGEGTPVPLSTNSKIAFSFIENMGFFLIRILWTVEDLYFNNQILHSGNTFFFYPGSSIITMNLEPVHGVFMGLVVFGEVENTGCELHFSKLWSVVNRIKNQDKNLFICEDLGYYHPNGTRGLIDFNLKAQSGDFIALMGSSGSGKSTLLNILNGNYDPTYGRVLFNGVDVHEEPDLIRSCFGYVPQDDLLIEDLTVFENLYFSARLSVQKLTKSQIAKKCVDLLKDVGLFEVKDIKVGNSLSKTISGGQRKRLNICLELIRNPQVLFMDEPTSGLSSRDSENIINLLRRLSFKGTLIFVVIHQPSSDIYKLFDKLILLDTGGFPIYVGDPVEAVSYFKRCINHITSNVTTCPACGNLNPEIIFDIVERKKISENGDEKPERKNKPEIWFKRFLISLPDKTTEKIKVERPPEVKNKNIFHQFLVFFRRDLLSKLYNTQFLLITLLEPLVLSLLLAFVVKFHPLISGDYLSYVFAENDNVPAFIFISIIVSIFMGLSLSAEEIFKDQKIQKREEFLSLSRFSYLGAKVSIQFLISFIQTIIFLLPSVLIIGNVNMFFFLFLILFSSACFGNLLSLNISSAFKTIGTIYILIPILLIPQLILGGIIISYDKMNPFIANRDKVPVLADMIASRWAYEAACLVQFKYNDYDRIFYDIDSEISRWNYKYLYWIPQMENKIDEIEISYKRGDITSIEQANKKVLLLRNEMYKESQINGFKKFDLNLISNQNISFENLEKLRSYILDIEIKYSNKVNDLRNKREQISNNITKSKGYLFLDSLQKTNHNKALEKLVLKRDDNDRIIEGDGRFVQIVDPIYNDVYEQRYQMDCRSNFFSPVKYLFGIKIDTFWFNIGVIWTMCAFLFLTLYNNTLKWLMNAKIKRKAKN